MYNRDCENEREKKYPSPFASSSFQLSLCFCSCYQQLCPGSLSFLPKWGSDSREFTYHAQGLKVHPQQNAKKNKADNKRGSVQQELFQVSGEYITGSSVSFVYAIPVHWECHTCNPSPQILCKSVLPSRLSSGQQASMPQTHSQGI